jgi:hypothetical protein
MMLRALQRFSEKPTASPVGFFCLIALGASQRIPRIFQ